MRAFFSLYLANFFLVGGMGLLTTYLALYLGQQNVSTIWIGALTSLYYLGLLFGAKVGYFLIKSVGHIRSFAACTAGVTACVSLHGVIDNLYVWLALRLVVGIGMMCNFMILESWLNEQANHEQRGRVFSVYMITSYLGTVLGQLALAQFETLDYAPLFLVCFVVSVGIVPIALTRRIHPRPIKPLETSTLSYFKLVPQSLTAMAFAGIINGSFYGLAPVFANQAGFDAQEIALFMSVAIVAGLLAQWPMGVLSDRVRRSLLLRFNAIALIIVGAAFMMEELSEAQMFILSYLFGTFAFTLYPLASALANSRVSDDERVGVSAALLVIFGCGAGIGSIALAQIMTLLGHTSLYGAIAVLSAMMFSLLTLINSRQNRERMAHSDYVFSASDVTQSPLAATLDPRIEGEIAQEQLLEIETHERL